MRRVVPLAVALALVASACVGATAARHDRLVIGFIFVGSHDDLGYNQAAWEGSEALARAFPDAEVRRVENVPEDADAVAALEDLVDQGATILFATSFGHLAAAYEVARRHPEVTVLHQGGVEPTPHLPNFGTYFGAHSEALYLAGITAGAATRSGRLGFVVAFPIPATFNNVNAFTLGARSVNPTVTTRVVFTEAWCDPKAQSTAASTLIAAGVDVIAQHQDCTRTILRAAESAGIYSVGYHADGSEVATTGWLVGAVWSWDALYARIVQTIIDGTFETSPYEGDFRGSLASGDNPFLLTEPGPSVTQQTRDRLASATAALIAGGSPFTGPILDQLGRVRVPAGSVLGGGDLDAMDWFAQGVEATVPR
ncbi:MAG: BMP family ABC transporter substrate-binding protein [Microthrixaceae bacterium]